MALGSDCELESGKFLAINRRLSKDYLIFTSLRPGHVEQGTTSTEEKQVVAS